MNAEPRHGSGADPYTDSEAQALCDDRGAEPSSARFMKRIQYIDPLEQGLLIVEFQKAPQ